MHHYRRHIKDYQADTAYLTLLDHGVYNQLIDLYYKQELPLPSDTALLARLIGARTDDELASLNFILGQFFYPNSEGQYKHNRIDTELNTIYEKSEKARINVEKRWSRERERQALKPLQDKEIILELYGMDTNVSKNYTNVSKNDTDGILPSNPVTHNPVTQNPVVQKTGATSAKRFKKPTVEEVQDYFEERTNQVCNIEHEKFHNFYESKGWKVGKNPMKDWRAAVRNWITRYKENYNKHGNGKLTETGRLKTTQQTIDNMKDWINDD